METSVYGFDPETNLASSKPPEKLLFFQQVLTELHNGFEIFLCHFILSIMWTTLL